MPEILIPETLPDMIGEHGKAWRCDVEAMRLVVHNPDDCTIAIWIVYAPWAHPIWHSYAITLVYLRDVPGVKAAHIFKPSATHEMALWALDPDHRPSTTGLSPYLSPRNFGGQLIAESDAAAEERIKDDVRLICAGQLNPDTDALRQWIARYGDDLFKPEYREAKGSA